MMDSLRSHWPEYLMEAALLGLFMVAAGVFTWALHHPSSAISTIFGSELARRAATGVLMGATAVSLVHSPWGRRSGAHMNPSLTLSFLRLGKVAPWDGAFYIAAQFAGGFIGIAAASVIVGPALASPEVRFAATVPGPDGALVALLGELVISFVLMFVVLATSNTQRLARWTPWFAGLLIAIYITFESPLSGMSMNAARTFGPAMLGGIWESVWVYFTAPLAGMLAASQLYVRLRGSDAVWCAKLHHANRARCIFRCSHPAFAEQIDLPIAGGWRKAS